MVIVVIVVMGGRVVTVIVAVVVVVVVVVPAAVAIEVSVFAVAVLSVIHIQFGNGLKEEGRTQTNRQTDRQTTV